MASRDRAAALRMLRGLRQITQRELARRTGVHHVTISQYERGQRRLAPHNLDPLLDALEVTPRAWESTIRHVAWIDHLTTAQTPALDGEAARLAESVARSFEMHTYALLHLLVALSGGKQ
jgi:transcriptional regulator with XRE-family HTH domain